MVAPPPSSSFLRPSTAEENYLKAVFKLQESQEAVSTNQLARELQTTPASVTDMIKRLAEKDLLVYKPYYGVSLTERGRWLALSVIRNRRLWEVFLVEHLKFTWDAVHEVAEQLEHVYSDLLTERLDAFLGYPRFDPHGDPIPDAEGNFLPRDTRKLSEVAPSDKPVYVAGVVQHDPEFLRYLDRLGLTLGARLLVTDRISFDNSCVLLCGGREIIINSSVAERLLVVLAEPR
jgi:DtxR family Mn-dependent transcriptional regulator